KTILKGQKYVVKSHVCDKAIKRQRQKLVEQAKRIDKPTGGRKERDEIVLYNSMVLGLQNYYRIATHVSLGFSKLQYAVRLVLHNRLKQDRGSRLCKTGRALTKVERERYGQSRLLRYVTGTGEPIYPIGCVQHKKAMAKKRNGCIYTPEGRLELHSNLRIDIALMLEIMRQPLYGRSVEYADNRISLFSAQWGKCSVTGEKFECVDDIHCHHKIPKSAGGTDKYNNLVLVLAPIHRLIHATDSETILKYLKILNLSKNQLDKLNKLREVAELPMIA
ncbi:HNH endonuclease, partial [Christensenellaceae bacterium OttesenSCG-928-L17]|nr:HNH endonuclease [Christensenellaceae bacterium OttesenSCG-928-L17]